MTDFEMLYRGHPDPWAVRTSWYERRKQTLLLSALPRERYGCAIELGCGLGATTRLLAARCATVHAVDVSATAMARCRQALARDGIANVRLDTLRLPDAWPLPTHESADLIVLSELAYYFSEPGLRALLARCRQSLAAGGDWVLCHYKAPFHDRCTATNHIHAAAGRVPGLRRLVTHDDEHFRLDIWRSDTGVPA